LADSEVRIAGPWENRIVGHGLEDPRELLAHPHNPKKHPKSQRRALAGILSDLGMLASVTKNMRTGHLLNGHLRCELAIEKGQSLVPVEYVDLDPDKEGEFLLTFDPITALAAMDAGELDTVLRDVHSGDEAVQELLTALATDAGLYREEYPFMGEDPEGEEEDGEDGDSEPALSAAERAMYPLAIVLSRDEFQLWQETKQRLAARTDKEALLMLMPED
jgi:hypothetical protein